jgi:hypothetical protein
MGSGKPGCAAILAALAGLGAGCDGSSVSKQPADAGPSVQAESAAAAYCARLKACDVFYFASRYDDDAGCVASSLQPFYSASQTSDTGVTEAYLLACLNARAAASCETIYYGLPMAECAPVAGTRSAGAQCYVDGQCANLRCVASSATVACGTCRTGQARGAACAADADCEGLLYCVNGVCGDLGVLAAPCAASSDCIGALGCLAGVCAMPLPVGAFCTDDADCGPEAGCVAGLCQLDQLVALGEACGPLDGGGYAQCAGQPVCSGSLCVLLPSVGQSCTTSGPDCAGRARCISGVCSPFDASLCPN